MTCRIAHTMAEQEKSRHGSTGTTPITKRRRCGCRAMGGQARQLSIGPGLLPTLGIALAAFALRMLPGFSFASPMILAVVIGIALNGLVGSPAAAAPGTDFVLRRLLRLGTFLLGLHLTIGQIAAVGAMGFVAIATTRRDVRLHGLARPGAGSRSQAELT